LPFNDTTNLRLQIAEYSQRILGDNLLGLQVGNEPDLYAKCVLSNSVSFVDSKRFSHGQRPPTYGPSDYFGEFGVVVNAMKTDPNLQFMNNLLGPSVATGSWTPEDVWNTGFIPAYSSNLAALTVEQYLHYIFYINRHAKTIHLVILVTIVLRNLVLEHQ
jgi:hypothetical protein